MHNSSSQRRPASLGSPPARGLLGQPPHVLGRGPQGSVDSGSLPWPAAPCLVGTALRGAASHPLPPPGPRAGGRAGRRAHLSPMLAAVSRHALRTYTFFITLIFCVAQQREQFLIATASTGNGFCQQFSWKLVFTFLNSNQIDQPYFQLHCSMVFTTE